VFLFLIRVEEEGAFSVPMKVICLTRFVERTGAHTQGFRWQTREEQNDSP